MDESFQAYQAPEGRIAAARWHVSRFVRECIRVFKITKKPTTEEFLVTFKVSGIGILAIGLIGFVIYLIREMIVK